MPIDWSLVPEYAAALVFGYLCGSIPFGILLTRLAGGPGLSSLGSGHMGRNHRLSTRRKGPPGGAAPPSPVGSIRGSLSPGWLRFRGGKGGGTVSGALPGTAWPAAVVFCAA